MRLSWCCGIVASSLILFTGLVQGNDSGPGPTTGAASKQYNVIVIRASGYEQGTFTFSGSNAAPSNIDTDGSQIDDQTPLNPVTGAANDPAFDTTGPGTTVNYGDVAPINGNTGTATTGTTTGGTTGTTTGGTTTMGGTTTGTTATTSDPPSYWTRARVNGQVSAQTSDASSSNYWTRARANGQVVAGDTGGDVGGGDNSESAVASGSFSINLGEQSTSGNWYSVDLGGFSLWYGSASSAGSSTETTTFAGYATSEIIVGRTSTGTGGMMEALFNGSFFVGKATDDDTADTDPNT